jgi:hypothetical protein
MGILTWPSAHSARVLGAPASRRPIAGNGNSRSKYAIFTFFLGGGERQRAAETAAFPGHKACGVRRDADTPWALTRRPKFPGYDYSLREEICCFTMLRDEATSEREIQP